MKKDTAGDNARTEQFFRSLKYERLGALIPLETGSFKQEIKIALQKWLMSV